MTALWRRGLAAAAWGLASASFAAEIGYALTVDPREPLQARFELARDDGARFGANATASPRGAQLGSAVQVEDVRCDGVTLASPAPSTWQLPSRGCRRLTWRSTLVALDARGVDASAQQSLFARGARFWVISEPASVLRVPEAAGGVSIRVRGVPRVQARAAGIARIPALSEAPGFLVLGTPSARRGAASGREVIHVSALPLDLAPLEGLHARALEYFVRVTGAPATGAPVTIVWLPVDVAVGDAGGAAGYDAFLANVVTRDGVPQVDKMHFAAHVLLHEQFHQIARTPLPLPTWLNESLAEFYARRAAEEARLDAGARAVLEARYPPLYAAPRVRLLQIQREIDAGNGENYARLYTDGSNFWMAVHRAIVANGHAAGIDDLMPLLLARPVPTAELPASWIGSLREAAGPAFDELMARFVGS